MRIEKVVKDIEIKNPLREFAKTRERVKSRATNNVTKNRGTTPKVLGSTK